MSWFLNWGIPIIIVLGDFICCRVVFVWCENAAGQPKWGEFDGVEKLLVACLGLIVGMFWAPLLALYGPYKLMTMPTRKQRRATKAAKVAASQAESRKQIEKIWQEYPELRLPELLN